MKTTPMKPPPVKADRKTQGVIRRYTFKLYPNKAQAKALDRIRRLHCTFYNAALQERIDAYRLAGKTLSHFDQGKSIKMVRADDLAYEAISADSMSFTLKRLDLAFQSFFRRVKSGAGFQSGFPRYKRGDDYPGFTHRPGQGWRFEVKPGARSGCTSIKGIPGTVKWRGEFPMHPYGIKAGDVMLRAGDWWLSIVADVPARMRATADHSGEVTFDLVDSFARVSRANSERIAGPDETVFSAAEGRITPVIARVCGKDPVEALQMEGEHGQTQWRETDRDPVEALQMEGEHGHGAARDQASRPVEALQMEGEHGVAAVLVRTLTPVEALQMEGEHGARTSASLGGLPVEALQMEGEHGQAVGFGLDKHPVEALQMEGEHGNSVRRSCRRPPVDIRQIKDEHGQRTKRGSYKDRRNKYRAARKQAREARKRREALHVWTTAIAREFVTLKITSPPLIAVTRSGRGNQYEHGAEVTMKASLNRHILDQAPGAAIAMLEYKVSERGGTTETIVAAGPAMVGNQIVEARKANNRLKQNAK